MWSGLAGARFRQGRYAEAARTAERAIAKAEAAGEDRALAYACWLLDSSVVRQGQPTEARHTQRAVEIYKRLGDTESLGRVLTNLGAFEAAAGRWDRAMELYGEAAEHATRAGDVISAAYGDCNIGETLSDQGRFDEAEPRLRRALQVWDGSGDEQGSAYARALLGRLAVRAGEAEKGRVRLEGALADAVRLRCDYEAEFARLCLAEASVAVDRPDDALRIVGGVNGGGDAAALAARIRALALAELGEVDGARAAFADSVGAARASGSDFEAAAALDGLAALAEDPEAAAALRTERDGLLGRLGVRRLPGPRVATSS
jgi:tetratricopeptide (TPR) repeat protein